MTDRVANKFSYLLLKISQNCNLLGGRIKKKSIFSCSHYFAISHSFVSHSHTHFSLTYRFPSLPIWIQNQTAAVVKRERVMTHALLLLCLTFIPSVWLTICDCISEQLKKRIFFSFLLFSLKARRKFLFH